MVNLLGDSVFKRLPSALFIQIGVGKATLRPESMGVFNRTYKLLNEPPDLSFNVEGQTDSDGDETSKQKLSEESTTVIKQVLVERGIASGYRDTTRHGEGTPIDSNNILGRKVNNRRVEFIKT